jgi:hypothetical protein
VVDSRRECAAAVTLVIWLLVTNRFEAARGDGPEGSRVRAEDPGLAAMIREATGQSSTFRHLVDAIDGSDGIVYVIRGRCRNRVRACLLLWMGVAGQNRILRVIVDERTRPGLELIASIAHELRHALEVLGEPGVRNGFAMLELYKRNGAIRGTTFETQAAIESGDAVYNELKRKSGGGK